MKIENRGDPSRKIQGIWNLPSEPYLINTFVLGKWILPKDKVSMNRVDALSQGGQWMGFERWLKFHRRERKEIERQGIMTRSSVLWHKEKSTFLLLSLFLSLPFLSLSPLILSLGLESCFIENEKEWIANLLPIIFFSVRDVKSDNHELINKSLKSYVSSLFYNWKQ